MSIYTPFTYLITHIPTGKRYYGVRYRKGCHPSDIGTKYFSSSKLVWETMHKDGLDKFKFEVRRTFNTAESARKWEHKVLTRLRVWENDAWLNQSNGFVRAQVHKKLKTRPPKIKNTSPLGNDTYNKRLVSIILKQFELKIKSKSWSKRELEDIMNLYVQKYALLLCVLSVPRRYVCATNRVKRLPFINQIKCYSL